MTLFICRSISYLHKYEIVVGAPKLCYILYLTTLRGFIGGTTDPSHKKVRYYQQVAAADLETQGSVLIDS